MFFVLFFCVAEPKIEGTNRRYTKWHLSA